MTVKQQKKTIEFKRTNEQLFRKNFEIVQVWATITTADNNPEMHLFICLFFFMFS